MPKRDDSDDLISDKHDGPDDLGGLCGHIFGMIPWKVVMFIFAGFILINTSTFVENILGSWPGAVEGRYPSEQGLLIQAGLLTLGAIAVSVFSGGGLI